MKYHRESGLDWQMKEDICNILQCAGLIHDIGNPPFGHFGETAIREWFEGNLDRLTFRGKPVSEVLSDQMREDLYHFEGNAQALRLVTKLHFQVDENGMNLTYALLNTIVKYPTASVDVDPTSSNICKKKMGYYYADREIMEAVQQETGTCGRRHPLTYILEAADDLAYATADIEDAFVKGFLSYHQLREELIQWNKDNADIGFDPVERLDHYYERGRERKVTNPEQYAIMNWSVRVQGFLISCATFGFTSHYREIMEGTWEKDLFYGTHGQSLIKLLKNTAFRYVFSSAEIYQMEVAEGKILDTLMETFVAAAIKYDTDQKLTSIETKLITMISDNYINAYHYHGAGKSEEEKLYLRLLLVTDHICGMTDSYAKRLYQELNGIL
jgi:dGTPase